MFKSFALVKKLKSESEELNFENFRLWKIGSSFNNDLQRAKHLFSTTWPLYEDYVYEREYFDDDDQKRAAYDIENTLLLMRLFKTGDLFFVNPCIETSDDGLLSQMPYPVMAYTHTKDYSPYGSSVSDSLKKITQFIDSLNYFKEKFSGAGLLGSGRNKSA